ncbi:hypothetical protein AKJ35_01420 [candidate division MSBL1 archaeon SCGC-AAA833F18]|uniref:ISXO2-like transposase domain-containing protein n=1 Tax=candidate division MSBL1 archaeon SCGC-AAA833F18 TaxID=1698257 RepID=A0A133VRL4_9EURY|nr:hypothetical protein AKJ35_01420 [candidate division MSBL1 archaeon SCGC-AAA833F18]
MGVRRSDGRICLNVLRGDSGLEFKSSLRRAEEELGPIVDLDSDEHKSYPWAAKQIGIIHRPVNRKKEGFVNEACVHSNGVENQWSMARDWGERARGYNSIESLRRAVKGRQVYHNQVKNSPVPVWAFLKIAISDSNRGYFLFIFHPTFSLGVPYRFTGSEGFLG